MRAALSTILVLLVIGTAMLWSIGSMATRSTNTAVDQPPAPSQRITLTARDGTQLVGSFWPGRSERSPGVVLLHGNGASRAQMFQTAQWLSERGYAAFAIDLRGHGESAPASKSFGVHEALDAEAAVSWLRKHQHGARVGAIGFSLGGAAMLIGKDGPVPVDALVVEAMYPDIRAAIGNRFAAVMGRFGGKMIEPLLRYQSIVRYGVWPSEMSPQTRITSINTPVFVIGGEHDIYTPPAETRAIYHAAQRARQLWIVADRTHDTMPLVDDPEWQQRVGAFLEAHLPVEG